MRNAQSRIYRGVFFGIPLVYCRFYFGYFYKGAPSKDYKDKFLLGVF